MYAHEQNSINKGRGRNGQRGVGAEGGGGGATHVFACHICLTIERVLGRTELARGWEGGRQAKGLMPYHLSIRHKVLGKSRTF